MGKHIKQKQSALPIVMEKAKLLTNTVIGLLLLNLATLGFLFVSGSKGHKPLHYNQSQGRPEPKEIIAEKLHFDANQQKEYENLIRRHRGAIKQLDENIRGVKDELYSELKHSEVNVITRDSLILLLAGYQKQIEITHFKHFEDIKKLCHKDQLQYFDDLTDELGRLFSRNKPPRPPHE